MYKSIPLLAIVAAAAITHSAFAFTHPGVLHTQTDLDRIKSKINAGVSPWSPAFNAFKASGYSKSTYTPAPYAAVTTGTGDFQIRYDATAAYQNAVMWYVTGQQVYATTAINIIDGWSTTLTSYDPKVNISAAIASLKFAAAGEILRYEPGSGWTSSNTTNLQNMLLNRLYPSLEANITGSVSGIPGDGNQGALSMQGVMAIGIFCDDTGKYNEAVNLYQGNANTSNPCIAVTYYIDASGCPGESGRDQGHSQLGVAAYAQAAQIAWCQGLDLYGFSSNRLLAAFEWLANYNLGNNSTWTNKGTCYSTYGSLSSISRGQWTMMYDMAYNHYAVLQGLSAPYTAQVLQRISPEGGAVDQPAFGTLFYSLTTGSGPTYEGTYEILNVNSSKAVGTVNGGTGQSTNLEQRTYSGASTQQWTLIPLGNEYYQLYPKGGSSSNVMDTGASPSRSGATIHLWGNGVGDNQIWKISTSSGQVQLASRDTILMAMPVTNLLAQISGTSTADGALLNMYTQTNGNEEKFTLTQIYAKTQASAYATQSGIQLETASEGGQDVCFISNGDYTSYNSVNIAGATQAVFRVASNTTGGTIEVHQGSSTGTLLGTATVGYTGAWQTYGTVSCSLTGASGVQNLYLVYKGGSGNLFNVLWFTFR